MENKIQILLGILEELKKMGTNAPIKTPYRYIRKHRYKGKKKRITCEFCKKKFWRFLSVINRVDKYFCSNDCKWKYSQTSKKESIIIFCKNEFCNKKMISVNYNKKFCSKKCKYYCQSNKYKQDLKIANDKKVILALKDENIEIRKKLIIKRNK